MAQEILGCAGCGWVARPELFEGRDPACPQCGRPLRNMDLSYARWLVAGRRRADRRREIGAKAHEFGLDRTERRDSG